MFNVALTGNVAAGKSEVTTLFAHWGATVIDADRLVRSLQASDQPVFRAIVDRFGPSVVRDDGSLDRAALRRMVLADDAARSALNAIVHPAVAHARREAEAAARGDGDCVVINDIPLLFEVLDPADFDAVVVVDAPDAMRRDRLTSIRGLDPESADRLMAAQLPARDKRDRADWVVSNDGSLEALEAAAWEVWTAIRKRAAAADSLDGPLLIVTADPRDAAWGPTGTMARYVDAGVEVHLACGLPVDGTSRARSALEHTAERLGVDHLHALTPVGGPSSGSPELPLDAVLGGIVPAVVLTMDARDPNTHADRLAINHWVLAARDRTARPPTVLHLGYPDDRAVGCPLPLTRHPAAEFAAVVDVRPWAIEKHRVLEAAESPADVPSLDDPTIGVYYAREWYVQPGFQGPIRYVLREPIAA